MKIFPYYILQKINISNYLTSVNFKFFSSIHVLFYFIDRVLCMLTVRNVSVGPLELEIIFPVTINACIS